MSPRTVMLSLCGPVSSAQWERAPYKVCATLARFAATQGMLVNFTLRGNAVVIPVRANGATLYALPGLAYLAGNMRADPFTQGLRKILRRPGIPS